MAQLGKEQIEHIQKLIELAIIYVADCDGCADEDCPLNIEVTQHTSDLPALPAGLKLCQLFDYIAWNTYRKRNTKSLRR